MRKGGLGPFPVLALAFFVGGCSVKEESNYAVVRVLYATDRSLVKASDPVQFYGTERSLDGKLSLGVCDVSIPRDHRMGHLERPSITKLEFREDPEKHVVLLNADQQSYEDFYRDMKRRIQDSAGHEAFIFVHGFDVSFSDAARRTAQMTYDLAFDGAPIFYSWPSQAKLASYTVDENNIEWTTQHFVWFVRDLVSRTHPSKVHLIAHSMGSRALVHVLSDGALQATGGPAITEVIFMAPDIDADTFKQLARRFHGSAKRVTLYASSNDEALKASKSLHGNPRAGESGEAMVLLPGIDTIDASAADTSAVGHWYYAERRSVLSDLFYLLKDGKPASERFGLEQKHSKNMIYYFFKP